MLWKTFFPALSFMLWRLASRVNGAEDHGSGAEGSVMGPVAFLWPSDRVWDGDDDNIEPCGSPASVGDRTDFPLDQGSVAITIADEAWKVAFRIAYGNEPKSELDFRPLAGNISEVEAGHQCYKVPGGSDSAASEGTNATIQMEYWASDEGSLNGKNESFFACADITLVPVSSFSLNPPCFNVTTDAFESPTDSSAQAAGSSASSSPDSDDIGSQSSSSSLSAGDKAGIAIGCIFGVGLIVLAILFLLLKRRKQSANAGMEHSLGPVKTLDAGSVGSRDS